MIEQMVSTGWKLFLQRVMIRAYQEHYQELVGIDVGMEFLPLFASVVPRHDDVEASCYVITPAETSPHSHHSPHVSRTKIPEVSVCTAGSGWQDMSGRWDLGAAVMIKIGTEALASSGTPMILTHVGDRTPCAHT